MKEKVKNNRASRSAGETVDGQIDLYVRDEKGRILTHGLFPAKVWDWVSAKAKKEGCSVNVWFNTYFRNALTKKAS